ncbi:MAG: hypothetical protein ACRDJ3_02085 [Solirubrobacteraceae bacterium]
MHRHLRRARPGAIAAVIAALSLLVCASALGAFSTTVQRAKDVITASSTPVTVKWAGLIPFTCKLSGGTFSVPMTNHNASGPITMTYTTRPSFSECLYEGKENATITTSGTWTIAVQYGQSTATVNIPTGGFTITVTGNSPESNTSPVALTGGWNNGFPSNGVIYTGATTAISTGGTFKAAEMSIEIFPVLETLTDTTHSELNLPLVGP